MSRLTALNRAGDELSIYRLLFAAVKDYGIFIVDTNGLVVTWNAGAEHITGYGAEEIIGQSIDRFHTVADVLDGKPKRELEFAAANGRFEEENWRLRKDGSAFWANEILTCLPDDDGAQLGFSVITRDITERKRQQADIDMNRLKLVESAQALGTMAGGIAHEINNPLAVIHGLSSDLCELGEEGTVTPADVVKATRRITQYAEKIAKIVKSLRHMGRDGTQDPFEEASVAQIVRDALDLCWERFKGHSVALLTAPVDPRLLLACREVQVSQILINLLQNAFDACNEISGEKWVRLTVTAERTDLVVSVSDSGNGVPPELRSRIMDAFFTTKPVGKGAGLGLNLSKRMAEEHGGSLVLASDSAHTCFILRLPRLSLGGE